MGHTKRNRGRFKPHDMERMSPGQQAWRSKQARDRKHARMVEKNPGLREALYGGNAGERRSLARLDSLTAAPATGHSKDAR